MKHESDKSPRLIQTYYVDMYYSQNHAHMLHRHKDTLELSWNYVAVGCGKDLQWWKEFFSVCRMMGYDGYVSLEMEDLTMSTEAGVLTSIDALKQTISQ